MPDDAGIRLMADHVVDVLHRLTGLFEQPADDARDDVTGEHEHFLAVHHHMVNADGLSIRRFARISGITVRCLCVRHIAGGYLCSVCRISADRLRSFPCFIRTRVDPRREDHIGSAGTEKTYIRLRCVGSDVLLRTIVQHFCIVFRYCALTALRCVSFFHYVCALDHGCTCTVSEENRGGAVLHRKETGQLFCADHEGIALTAHSGEAARDLEAIDEAAAGCIDIKRRYLRKPKLPLEDRCDARCCEIRGHARHDDRADGRRRNALAFCLCECLSGRLDGEGHGTFLCAAEAACVDAGTWIDPGIGGIHLLT